MQNSLLLNLYDSQRTCHLIAILIAIRKLSKAIAALYTAWIYKNYNTIYWHF